MFTAPYAPSPYIKQTRLVFKELTDYFFVSKRQICNRASLKYHKQGDLHPVHLKHRYSTFTIDTRAQIFLHTQLVPIMEHSVSQLSNQFLRRV